jgi:hypothetical protein
VNQATDEVRGRVDHQRYRAADTLRSTGEELHSLADKGEYSRLTTELTRLAAQQARSVADYLERTSPADAVEQVRTFARRRPGAFLFAAALAGVVTGRLVRAAASGGGQDSSSRTGYGLGTRPGSGLDADTPQFGTPASDAPLYEAVVVETAVVDAPVPGTVYPDPVPGRTPPGTPGTGSPRPDATFTGDPNSTVTDPGASGRGGTTRAPGEVPLPGADAREDYRP